MIRGIPNLQTVGSSVWPTDLDRCSHLHLCRHCPPSNGYGCVDDVKFDTPSQRDPDDASRYLGIENKRTEQLGGGILCSQPSEPPGSVFLFVT